MYSKTIYLDNAATTRVDPRVVEEMKLALLEEYGNPSSLHGKGRAARELLERARERFAKLINAEPEEIVFTSGGTESDNLALKGVARAKGEKRGRIIVSAIEHKAITKSARTLQREGFEVKEVGVDSEGFVNLNELESAMDGAFLVSIIHGNSEIGTIQNLKEISNLCQEVTFHSDAVQSFAKRAIDVKREGVDMMSFSSHKIHGPKGVGALYIRNGLKIESMMDGGPHENRKRAGTENLPGILGFVKVAELFTKKDVEQMKKLRDSAIKRALSEIPDSKLNGPFENRLPNNINLAFRGVEGEATAALLADDGICISTGSACASRNLSPSHVLLAIGLEEALCNSAIRMTLSKYTTKEEMEFSIDRLCSAVARLREISPLKGGR